MGSSFNSFRIFCLSDANNGDANNGSKAYIGRKQNARVMCNTENFAYSCKKGALL